MPEGPEVEAARVLVDANVLNLKIVKAIAADDEKVFMGKSPGEVAAALEGRKIVKACRKGKYLWFELDWERPHLMLHFGMTGSIAVENVGAAKYKRINVDMSAWPPKFTKLELVFEGDVRLAFTDARRFGKCQLLDDPRNQEPISKLGFDIITDLPSLSDFKTRLARYQKPGSVLRIKALLLDQAFSAGVGNWVADEVLYQARIHPEQPVADMPDAQVDALHTALASVTQLAVAANADSEKFPQDWLFHYRWTGKKASSVGGKAIDFITVGSRTSAYVPALQKVISGTGLSKQAPQRAASQGAKKPRAPKAKAAAGGGQADEDGAIVISSSDEEEEGGKKAKKVMAAKAKPVRKRAPAKRKKADGAAEEADEVEDKPTPKRARGKAAATQAVNEQQAAGVAGTKTKRGARGKAAAKVKEVEDVDRAEEDDAQVPKAKRTKTGKAKPAAAAAKAAAVKAAVASAESSKDEGAKSSKGRKRKAA